MTFVNAYNERTGLTVLVPEDHVTHPVFGLDLREVRSPKRRARLSEIVKDNADSEESAERLTDTAAPDKDKED